MKLRLLWWVLCSSFLVVWAVGSAGNGAVEITDMTGQKVQIANTARVVTLGSSLTETVFALGAASRLVAVDATSNSPQAAKLLPQLPSARSVTIEAILNLKPSLVLVLDSALPDTIKALRQFAIPTVVFSNRDDLQTIETKIRLVAQALSLEVQGEVLIRSFKKDIALARSLYSSIKSRPKVMFLYSGTNGRITVAGRETAADAMIQLAGGRNPFQSYTGYAPLSQEAALLENPDVVMMTALSWQGVGGAEGLLKLPAIAGTSAGRNKRFLSYDGNYLLGFGPRVGQAVLEVMYALHPELKRR